MMNINPAVEGLIHLVRSSFGIPQRNCQNLHIISDIYKLSLRQEVASLAFDGILNLSQLYPESPTWLDKDFISKDTKLQWLGCVITSENQYRQNLMAAKSLADYFDNNGIMTYVLKGFSISRLYPIPAHRFSCDLDCYLMSENGEFDAFKKGNALIASKGINVDKSYYKHSAFTINGLPVENHQFCCSIKRGKRTKEMESYLRSLLNNYQPQYIEGTKLALPPEMFQALFMIEHANGHFLYSKMNLKQICDWAILRKSFQETLDWQEFNDQCKKYGLKGFVESMNHLADYILGDCPYDNLTALDKRVLDDMFIDVNLSSNKMKQRIEKAIGVLRSNWKFKYFCGDSMLKELTHSVWSYLTEINPELD